MGVGCRDCSERVMQAISFSALNPLQQFLLLPVTSHEPPHLSLLQSLCLHPVPVLSLSFIVEPVPAFQSSASGLRTEGRRPCPNVERMGERGGVLGLDGQLITHLPSWLCHAFAHGGKIVAFRSVGLLIFIVLSGPLGTLGLDSTELNWIYLLKEFIQYPKSLRKCFRPSLKDTEWEGNSHSQGCTVSKGHTWYWPSASPDSAYVEMGELPHLTIMLMFPGGN